MKLGSCGVLAILTLVAACGSSTSELSYDDTDAGGQGGSNPGAAGSNPGAGGGSAAGGGVGGTVVPGQPCSETYSGPALEKNKWIDVTVGLTGVKNLWAVPKQDRILAQVPGKGVWAYTAAGNAWSQVASLAAYTVSQIVFDPGSCGRFWMASSGGVLFTDDNAQTVNKLGSLTGVTGIGVDVKGGAKTMIAAKAGSFYVSTDGGTTWDDKSAALTSGGGGTNGWVFMWSPTTYTASSATPYGLFTTDDSGATWKSGNIDNPAGYPTPEGEPLQDYKGIVYWEMPWHISYFSSWDNRPCDGGTCGPGMNWYNEWFPGTHALGGGGHPIEVPSKCIAPTASSADPTPVWMVHRCNSHDAVCAVADEQNSIVAMARDVMGKNRAWWNPLTPPIPTPIAYDSNDGGDQLAYDSVAKALFVASVKGSASTGTKVYVWMWPFSSCP